MIALRVARRPGAAEGDEAVHPLLAEGPTALTIGRADECDLVLADPLRLVSRRHAHVSIADASDDPALGRAAVIRCISNTAPLFVNGERIDPGGESTLQVGDLLRLGGFELIVEPYRVRLQMQSRLDRWFDLDDAPDPLAADSPLPELAQAPDTTTGSAVVSWQKDPHVVQTGTSPKARPKPMPMPAPPSKSASSGANPPAPEDTEPMPLEAFAPAPDVKRVPATPSRTAPPLPTADAHELAAAFARGAGLQQQAPGMPITPESMEHLGALLRATAEGTLALLRSRAVAKRHMRAEVTHIGRRQNNPLKFSPDATEALTRLLQREATPGFLGPIAALHDAHRDLLVHQVAMVAGMRAAVFELFSRLGPDAAEQGEGPAVGLSRLPLFRAAALWARHRMQHARLLEHLDDDFEAIFGREFLRAYEAQSRGGDAGAGSLDREADPASPFAETPWPGTH